MFPSEVNVKFENRVKKLVLKAQIWLFRIVLLLVGFVFIHSIIMQVNHLNEAIEYENSGGDMMDYLLQPKSIIVSATFFYFVSLFSNWKRSNLDSIFESKPFFLRATGRLICGWLGVVASILGVIL